MLRRDLPGTFFLGVFDFGRHFGASDQLEQFAVGRRLGF